MNSEHISEIRIHTNRVKFPTAPEFYGLFFEDINHAADGGLYPEMIRNRAFEDSLIPEGCQVDDNQKIFVTEYGWPGAFNHGEGMDEWAAAVPPTPVPGWYGENAALTLVTEDTLNANRKAALRVDFQAGGRLYNIGYRGVPVREGDGYHLYFMAKSSVKTILKASLESESGEDLGSDEIRLEESREYIRYDCDLTAWGTDFKGRISLVSKGNCRLLFGFSSLMPRKTFKNHGLREDLAMALKNTHAKFIRFPGGCVVEGINEQNSLIFSRTIGPVWERPGAQLMWHYRTTNGLGFHEYLQLCEDLEMEAMYVCNCGISCQARHGRGFDDETTQAYLQEALNALEYALGSEDTPYGSLRAKYGRKEPFRLKYVEIGNENWGPDYEKRYELFYQTLKKAYPQVVYISDGHTERAGLPTEFADEHYYDAPEFFLENGDLFDSYDRNGPKIFLGEYAVNGGNTIASMECALAESAFLLGAERNQDIVRLTAYAPLFQNSDYTAWKPNMIVFDNHQVYGIPSYHAVSLLAKYRGREVVEFENICERKPPVYHGIPGLMCEKEGLLFKNATVDGNPVEISRCIYGDVEKVGDEYRMTAGDCRHHCTGKSQEWNEAFEAFLGSRDSHSEPAAWVAFGDRELTAFTFAVDIKAEPDNPITLSVWNYRPETDAGCNEPRDTEWNLRSVRNQVWQLKDGVSALRVPRFFDKPLTDAEQEPVSIDFGVYNHFEIVCTADGYACYINGKLIQNKELVRHPLIHGAAVQDEDRIYLKLVNVDREEKPVKITTDCPVAENVRTEVISADPWEVNSFEEKEHIRAVCGEVAGGREFVYRMPPCSVNVLIMEKDRKG